MSLGVCEEGGVVLKGQSGILASTFNYINACTPEKLTSKILSNFDFLFYRVLCMIQIYISLEEIGLKNCHFAMILINILFCKIQHQTKLEYWNCFKASEKLGWGGKG